MLIRITAQSLLATGLSLLMTFSPLARAGNGQTESAPPTAVRGLAPTTSGGGGGTNQSASSGRAAENMGKVSNMLSGASLIATGQATSGWGGSVLIAMGVLAIAQGFVDGKAAGYSGDTYDKSLNSFQLPDYGLDNPDPNGRPLDFGTACPIPSQCVTGDNDIDKAWQKALADGYIPDKNGSVTLPNGKKFFGKDLTSPEAMIKAGVPEGSIAAIQAGMASAMQSASSEKAAALAAKLDSAAAKGDSGANVVAMGVDSGGGGGGAGGYDRDPDGEGGGGSNFDSYLKKLRNPFGLSAKERQAMVAGKSRAVGDDAIGVSMDDIFGMVHRRYQERRAINDFIEPAAAAAAAGGHPLGAGAPLAKPHR